MTSDNEQKLYNGIRARLGDIIYLIDKQSPLNTIDFLLNDVSKWLSTQIGTTTEQAKKTPHQING